MNFARVIHVSAFLAVSVWCTAIVVAPLLAAGDGLQQAVSDALYFFFGKVCHQIDSRSFHLEGYPLAVCSRCFGIYAGFCAGAILLALKGFRLMILPAPSIVLTALTPMVIDVAGATLGLYEPTNSLRLLTGFWFGAVMPFCLVPLLREAVMQWVERLNTATFVPILKNTFRD